VAGKISRGAAGERQRGRRGRRGGGGEQHGPALGDVATMNRPINSGGSKSGSS